MHSSVSIPGYDYGTARVRRSPVTLDELRQLEQAAGFSEEDQHALQCVGEVLANQAEQMVDSWRARIAAQPELARWFFDPSGKPDEAYKAAVKEQIEAAVQLEAGVLALYSVTDKDNPAHVFVFEMYADIDAYKSHLETAHFKKYKVTTQDMVPNVPRSRQIVTEKFDISEAQLRQIEDEGLDKEWPPLSEAVQEVG